MSAIVTSAELSTFRVHYVTKDGDKLSFVVRAADPEEAANHVRKGVAGARILKIKRLKGA